MIGLILLILTIVAGWVMTLLSLPGNWVMVAAAALFAYLAPDSGPDISWTTVAVLGGLATLAEIIEFAAGALGAAKVGGSKRGAALAALGSMIGAIAGALIGVPIPLVGSVVGAILFACLGALGGAMLGEQWKGRNLAESWQIGQAAFWGRLVGTLTKTAIASAMAVIAITAGVF
ncbi:MAG TPA: DUF456 domain-containing protein [Pirellulales bacterium]|nr:DUF456 domain-containing protein [Pirellulales bacterium]